MRRKRPPIHAHAAAFRQLADALHGGLPLAEAAAILAKAGARVEGGTVLDRWIGAIAGGASLADALAGEGFPAEMIALVRHGEETGALPDALEVIARDLEYRGQLATGMKGVLAWPALVVLFFALIISVTMIFVIPVYKDLFRSFGADLPGPTLLLVAVSDLFVSYWFWGALVVAAVAVPLFWRRAAGKRLPGRFDHLAMRIPFLNEYLRAIFVVRMAQVIGLAESRASGLAHYMAYLRSTAGNSRLAAIAAALEAQLRSGKDLVSSLWATEGIPATLATAAEIGERGNRLRAAMARLGDSSEYVAARNLVRFQQAMMFVTYVGLAVFVGLVVVALYLPIFKMGQAI